MQQGQNTVTFTVIAGLVPGIAKVRHCAILIEIAGTGVATPP
jgi:hypothetical protein